MKRKYYAMMAGVLSVILAASPMTSAYAEDMVTSGEVMMASDAADDMVEGAAPEMEMEQGIATMQSLGDGTPIAPIAEVGGGEDSDDGSSGDEEDGGEPSAQAAEKHQVSYWTKSENFPDEIEAMTVVDLDKGSPTPVYNWYLYNGEDQIFRGWDPAVSPTVEDDAEYHAIWEDVVDEHTVHKVEVHAYAMDDDGYRNPDIAKNGTFDVYINDEQVMNDVNDCVMMVDNTSEFRIDDVKASAAGEELKNGDREFTYMGTEDKVQQLVFGASEATYNGEKPQETEPQVEKFTITFDAQGGSTVEPMELEKGAEVVLPQTARAGYDFVGWFTAAKGGIQVTNMTVSESLTLYAHWQKQAEQFTVTYKDGADGTVFADLTFNVKDGDPTPAFGEDPVRTDYIFKGWSPKVEDTVTANAEYVAVWEAVATYTVTYKDGADGSVFADLSFTAKSGDATPKFGEAPVREGYEFKGWSPAVAENVSGDVVYTAQWAPVETEAPQTETEAAKTVTITFDSQGGNAIAPVTAKVGDSVVLPTPVRDGWIFEGWFTAVNGGSYVQSLTASSDLTLYAHWYEEKQTVTISFDANGGTAVNPMEVAKGAAVALPSTERDGYTFDGWYTDPTGGTKVTALNATEDLTLYAHWTKNKEIFTVRYTDGANGEVFTDVVYSVEEGSETPAFGKEDPKREDYNFKGWDPEVEDTVTENVVYTAKWEEAPSQVASSGKGKGDSTAPTVKTGDINIIALIGGAIASLGAIAGAVWYFLRRRFAK